MANFGWVDFYLVCFIVGFALTIFSLFAGLFDVHLDGHVGNGHFHFGGHHGVAHGHAGGAHGAQHGHSDGVSPFNFSTITAFLTWFGAAGYLLMKFGKIVALMALGLSTFAGLAGGSIVFFYLAKFLMKHDKTMVAADFDMVGVIGRLSVPIREGGTGELVYTQGGTRKSVGACSQDGRPIERQEEVVVMKYDKGIAYVRPWKELSDEGQYARDSEAAQ